MAHVLPFYGHPNIRSTHRTTTEITTESHLSVKGDCIVGVSADSGCAGLPDIIKDGLRNSASTVVITISVGDARFVITGKGDARLTLTHPYDIVIRKSSFVCSRTLAVGCDMASADMPRGMVRALQKGTRGTMSISVSSNQSWTHSV